MFFLYISYYLLHCCFYLQSLKYSTLHMKQILDICQAKARLCCRMLRANNNQKFLQTIISDKLFNSPFGAISRHRTELTVRNKLRFAAYAETFLTLQIIALHYYLHLAVCGISILINRIVVGVCHMFF